MFDDNVHVDNFIEKGLLSTDHRKIYAAGILRIFRLPALFQPDSISCEGLYPLFCDYQGKRYRITGASRLGNVWLRKVHSVLGDDDNDRVNIYQCSNFGPVA
jgi:hypothetical protein